MRKRIIGLCMIATLLLASGCNKSETDAAEQGAEVTASTIVTALEGTYVAEENTASEIYKWVFSEDGTLHIINQFEYSKVDNGESMEFTMKGARTGAEETNFNVKKSEDKYIFNKLSNGQEVADTATEFTLTSGEDGLSDTEPFDGVYDCDALNFSYHFLEDGTLERDTKVVYAIHDTTLLVNDEGSETAYQFSIDKEQTEIKITVHETEITLTKES